MFNLLIIFISTFVLVLSFKLFKLAGGSMSLLKLNTVSYIFYFQIITSGFVGSILLATGMLDYHYLSWPITEFSAISAWGWVMYSMIIMPISMVLLNRVYSTNPAKLFPKLLTNPVVINKTPFSQSILSLLCVIIVIATTLYIIAYTTDIPIWVLINKGKESAKVARVTAKLNFGGIIYIKNIIGMVLVPCLSYYLFAIWYAKKGFLNLVYATIGIGLASFILIHDTQKAPIAFFMLGFIVLYSLIKGGLKFRTVLIFFSLSVLLILLGYQLTSDTDMIHQLVNFNSAFYGRVFVSGYMGFPLSLELFPYDINANTFLSGIPGFFLNIFGVEHKESARLLMEFMNPEGVRLGISNLISGFYLGQAYANYGIIGLVLAPVIAGTIIQSVHIFILKTVKSPLNLAFYSYITVKWLLAAGFVTFLYLKIILFPIIGYLLIMLLKMSIEYFLSPLKSSQKLIQ